MSSNEPLKIVATAGLAATLVAIATAQSHRWVRVTLVLLAFVLAGTATYLTYRYVSKPKVLTVAVGSVDGDVSKIMNAVAARMADNNSPVRLKIVDKSTITEASKAFASGEVDLAIVRADVGNLSAARTLVLVTHGVVLLVVPPGSPINSIADLKGKTVGIVGGAVNRPIADMLTKEYDLARAKVHFTDISPSDLPKAVQSKQVNALLVVMPITEKYLTLLRSLFPSNGKKNLIILPIESAGAIAELAKAYESYDLPKGTIRGSPPIPDDDLTTLRVPIYLVASQKLNEDTAATVTKAMIETRRDLVGEFPLLGQVMAPSTDKDAYVPIHPGAAAYFDGSVKSFFDKYGDPIFYGSLLLGTLTSIMAGAWSYMFKQPGKPEDRPLNRLYAFVDRIRKADNEDELTEIERGIDDILKSELERYAGGEIEAGEAAALSLATHRLEYLIGQRRIWLGNHSAAAGSVIEMTSKQPNISIPY